MTHPPHMLNLLACFQKKTKSTRDNGVGCFHTQKSRHAILYKFRMNVRTKRLRLLFQNQKECKNKNKKRNRVGVENHHFLC